EVAPALGDATQRPDEAAHRAAGVRRQHPARRCLVERRECVGEARHRAADADAAGVHAAAGTADGAARHDVALNHRPPASELHQTFLVTVLLGEQTLFVEATAYAALMH